jgi:hypothetical protein
MSSFFTFGFPQFTESILGSSTPGHTNHAGLSQNEIDGEKFVAQFPSALLLACDDKKNCRLVVGLSIQNISVACEDAFLPIEFRFKNRHNRWEKDAGYLSDEGFVFVKKPESFRYECPPIRKLEYYFIYFFYKSLF